MTNITFKLLSSYASKLYNLKKTIETSNASIQDFIDKIDEYTIQNEDEDLNDGYIVGDILYYKLFSDFALFLRNEINNDMISEEHFLSCINLIEDMYNEQNEEVQILVETSILEILADTKKCRNILVNQFQNNLLDIYKKVIRNLK